MSNAQVPFSPFALVACQRTGTHLLREILNTNPYIAVLCEPFTVCPQDVYWVNYVKTLPSSQYPPPFPDNAMALLDEYLQVIRLDIDTNADWYGGLKPQLKALGLDIKYNQLKSVAPSYIDLRARPFLLHYFSSRQVRIVHLVRNNLVQTALSIIISNIRKVWQNYDGSTIQGRYRISPEHLSQYVNWVKEERDEFLRLSSDLTIHTCSYEDLVEELRRVDSAGNFPVDTKALQPLAAFLDVPNQFRYGGLIRKVINKPYAEILENYDELVKAVAVSEFSEYAPTLKAA